MLRIVSFFFEEKEEILPEGTEFYVRVEDETFDLCFDKRKDALVYKQIIKKSKRKFHGHIIRTEFQDGFITDTKEVF